MLLILGKIQRAFCRDAYINVKRCVYSVTLKKLPLFRLRYFLPKSSNSVKLESERKKNWSLNRKEIPEDYELIYDFAYKGLLLAGSIISLSLMTGAVASYFLQESNKEGTIVENTSEPEGLLYKITPGKMIAELGPHSNEILLGVGCTIIVFTFLITRKVVLASYRQGNKYITVFNNMCFGSNYVHHGAEDCVYYPNRMIFLHEILGKKVILFNECFSSPMEESKLCSQIRYKG